MPKSGWNVIFYNVFVNFHGRAAFWVSLGRLCVCVCKWGGGGHHFPEFGQASKTEAIFAEKIWNLAIPMQDLLVSDNFREKIIFSEKNIILAAILDFENAEIGPKCHFLQRICEFPWPCSFLGEFG